MDSIFIYRKAEASGRDAGPLKGLKIAISSNIPIQGELSEAGSQALAGFTALEDAAVVARLTQNGATLVGATQVSEFGLGLLQNAAGEAIVSGEATAELALDLAGEVRLAAARASLWGFKPSYGLIPRLGIAGLIPSMEACGILTSTPGDIRNIVKAIAGPDERDFSQPAQSAPDFSYAGIDPEKVSLGFIEETVKDMPAAAHDAFEEEIYELQKAGFAVRKLSLPEYPLFRLVHSVVGSVEASSSAGRYDSVRYGRRAPGAKNWNEMYLQSRGASFGALLKSYLIQGAFFQFEQYSAYDDACRIRARLLHETQKLFEQIDFLVGPAQNPVAGRSPDTLAGFYDQVAHTLLANVTGGPALYVPPSGPGRPGVELVGALGADARLLDLGDFLSRQPRGGK